MKKEFFKKEIKRNRGSTYKLKKKYQYKIEIENYGPRYESEFHLLHPTLINVTH